MVFTVRASGDKGQADLSVLFDTGATHSFIRRDAAEKIATIVKLAEPIEFRNANAGAFKVTQVAVVSLAAGSRIITDTFLILEAAIQDMIFGESTMRRFGVKIDMERGEVYAEITENRKEPDMWKKFLAAIGITVADEVTEEKAAELVKAKIKDAAKAPIASPKILAALDLKEDATEDQARGVILALKSPGNVVTAAEHEKLQAELHEHKIIAAVAQARADGKISPAEEPVWLKDLKDGKETLGMDGHHANAAGEYLGACVWYEVLFKESAVGNPFVPKELKPEDAEYLQGVAHRAVEAAK